MFVQGRSGHSTAKGIKISLAAVLAAAGMAASAAAGAWYQARHSTLATISVLQERSMTDQVSRDSTYIRENVNLLASRVGALQAKLIAMGGISKRVAQAAGVSYTDPEIQTSLENRLSPVMDYISSDTREWTAEGLGRQLDSLQHRLGEQQDWFAMLDLVLTKRVGLEAQLPTLMPVNYPYLSSSFGWRRNPVTGRNAMHEGLDFAAPAGSPIHAASGGVATFAGYRPGYGKVVELHHGNGLVTRYAHASKLTIKAGDLVEKGALIARVGSTGRSTGAHLHFEVRMAGFPLDPTLFLAKPDQPGSLMADASKEVKAVLPEVR